MKFKLISIFLVMLSLFLGAQKIEDNTKKNLKTDKSLLVKQDSLSLLEANKKAKQAEMSILPKPYHPEENATEKLSILKKRAQKENKNILIQAGGNWCIWCLRFNNFVQNTPELKEIIDKNFLYYHLNWSPENKNTAIFKKYGNPGEKYGYPVFIILDKNGKQIHTQDSSVLEEGSGYNKQKVKEFFEQWLPKY